MSATSLNEVSLRSPILGTLGKAWQEAKLHGPLVTHLTGEPFGQPEAGEDRQFDIAELMAHAAKPPPLAVGTIFDLGTIATQDIGWGASCQQPLIIDGPIRRALVHPKRKSRFGMP